MRVVIIGAGASGLMTAVTCAKGNEVLILERNEKAGKKIYITGKGRCNITNTCDDFLSNVVRGNKFLMSALSKFNSKDTINFFEQNGTKLKVERGNRVFPKSDKASDITKTFLKVLGNMGVKIKYNCLVNKIEKRENEFEISTSLGKFTCDAVVVATGGKSYSLTGSTGDGYTFARNFGHTVTPPKPSLVPLVIKNFNSNLAGLTLKNVRAEITVGKKSFGEFGEMLFTHKGLSGPIILTLTSKLSRENLTGETIVIDLKPALTVEQLSVKLEREFKENNLKSLKTYLRTLLPSGLIGEFLEKGKFDGDTRLCDINKEIRQKICFNLKHLSYIIEKTAGFDEAIVTSGGITLGEINPKNMESKLVKNLFFVGEALDVDALTGGFNLQIALSTGYACGDYLRGK